MDTAEERYDQLTGRVFDLYDEGRQRAALDLLDPSADTDELRPWFAELAHVRACLLGSLGEPAEALRVLQAASDAGGWWNESILTDDDDLAGLDGLPGFEELLAVSRERCSRGQVSITPPLIELPAQQGPACGLVVALHGASQRASHARRNWAAVLDLGYALVCVESSRLMSPMYRTWPDPEHAAGDIARALEQLPEALRGLPLIAAGFSAGGRAALNWALTSKPEPAAGVVVFAPALRELPEAAKAPLSPATILIGAADDLVEVVDMKQEQLAGLGVTIDRVPGLAHEFPQDFGRRLAGLLPSCG